MAPGKYLAALFLAPCFQPAAAGDGKAHGSQIASRIEPTTWTVALQKQNKAESGMDLAAAAKGLAAGLATGALCDRLLLMLGGSCGPTAAPTLTAAEQDGPARLRAQKASLAQIALAGACGAAALAASALVGAGCALRKERATRARTMARNTKKVKAVAVSPGQSSSPSCSSTGTRSTASLGISEESRQSSEAMASREETPLKIAQNLLVEFEAAEEEESALPPPPSLPPLPPVQVCARIRPVLPSERAEGAARAALDLRTGVDGSVVVKGDKNAEESYAEKSASARAFHFNAVLGPENSQADVWEQTQLSCLVGRVVAGFHATVLAYGQTGTGKTYTVEGALERGLAARRFAQSTASADVGLVPRAVKELFERLAAEAAEEPEATFAVKMSFLQIYKERIYDLLQPPTKSDDAGLRLRLDPAQSQFYAEGLTEVECADADAVFHSYSAGLQHRNVAATIMNTHSSRSHAILSLTVTRSRPVRAKACDALQEVKSVMTFVDLAGSERACADVSRMQEAANINHSLFVLRKVVACLTGERAAETERAQQRWGDYDKAQSTRKRRPTPGTWSLSASTGQLHNGPESPSAGNRRVMGEGEHVPFRESKLTSLLQHAFGGNSFLLMIACLSPLDQNFDENLSTLKYAVQTMNIRNEPIVNLDPKDKLIQQLQQDLAALKARARLP